MTRIPLHAQERRSPITCTGIRPGAHQIPVNTSRCPFHSYQMTHIQNCLKADPA